MSFFTDSHPSLTLSKSVPLLRLHSAPWFAVPPLLADLPHPPASHSFCISPVLSDTVHGVPFASFNHLPLLINQGAILLIPGQLLYDQFVYLISHCLRL